MKFNSLIKHFLVITLFLFVTNIFAQKEKTKIDSVFFGDAKKGGKAIFYYKNDSLQKIQTTTHLKEKITKSEFLIAKDTLFLATEIDDKGSTVKSKFKNGKLISQAGVEAIDNRYRVLEEKRLLKKFKKLSKLSGYDKETRVPFLTKDTIVFGVLMLALGFVFFTSSKKEGFWSKFYKIVPSLFMAYLIPAILTTAGLISPEWETVNEVGEVSKHKTSLYYMASRYLLPAALVLMTLSIDLKSVFNLGWKALAMFFTGTVGIVIGGPIAILVVSIVSPETLNGAGPDAVWRGLSTLAGSWIGGGANQTAMLEIYGFNQKLYGGMVFVDIVVANIWMALILIGIGKSKRIDTWLKADNTAIEELKDKVSSFSKKVERNPTKGDLIIMAAIAFGAVSLSHLLANFLSGYFEGVVENIENATVRNIFTFLGSQFFWMISIATIIAIALSFTKVRQYEGAGASKIGGVFIYILVITIGMKMDLTMIFDNLGLVLIGIIWMTIHALLLILIAKLIKAPYFFLAVGSQANVGGAASAPIVASAFHPSLATVGVLLAVLGYAVGTVAAIGCTILMQIVSGG